MNRFVDPVRQQNLSRIKPEKTGDFFFSRLTFGIARAANIPLCSR
jgi:hypothetical protein